MNIVWRDKLLAFGVHFIATAVLAAIAAALIFLVWYPHPFELMVRGLELFTLVVGCDLALGPLLSFVVFNRSKTWRALAIDYTVIGIVQIAGMVYGVYTVAESRPVYVAFTVDRYEVVAARDLKETELAAAAPAYRSIPLGGPRYVGVRVPEKERDQELMDELAGNPPFARPKWYVDVASLLPDILERAKTIEELEHKHPDAKAGTEEALADVKVPRDRLRWVPISTRAGFWTAFIDTADGLPVAWLNFDPY
ncbi:MAG TPA: TfpX/TfpZ family type IV pilin accessory protein [Steroidobacteraceae bacterium]|nr:TfpX/TfpZ family type IV pilin accessory protein [Steroidobacteraceae bacterium]